mmetsp:Transcript_30127/g.76110  ORF Transcript_30127/g.76110 Transcript_30127/m.76110 type:complete len:345 (-) Transcript_30127:337-1371(-)
MALATLEIVEIVRWSDLDATRAKLAVNHRVGDHCHLSVREEWVLQLLAHELFVSVVLWMDANGHITQHRLNTGRGNSKRIIGALQLVFEFAHDAHLNLLIVARDRKIGDAMDFLVVNLQVRKGSAEMRAPIHKAIVSVNQALIMEANEGLHHRPVQHRVHGEPLTRPIGAGGNLVQLVLDAIAVLLLPCPHTLKELLAAKIMTSQLLVLVQEALHHALGGDTSMVGTRHPQGHIAAHPVPARKRILDGSSERVPNVKGSCDVGRGDDHDKTLGLSGALGGFSVRCEESFLLPPSTPSCFHSLGVVDCGHIDAHVLFLSLRCDNNRRSWCWSSLRLRLGLLVCFA